MSRRAGVADQVSITIRRVGDRYEATVKPPNGNVEWSTTEPMMIDELDRKLVELGCHPTDIGDAFYEADPDWVERTKP